MIQAHNRKNNSFSLGINKFADQTPEEMRRRKGLIRRKEGEVGNVPFPYTTSKIGEIAETLPKQFDLRLLGVISPVGGKVVSFLNKQRKKLVYNLHMTYMMFRINIEFTYKIIVLS